jgi:hypothetical protein
MYLQIPLQLNNVFKAPLFFLAFIITKIVSFMDFAHRLVY